MDLISVIIPVYKVEAYLDRCVNSVVEQSYTNLEIILVDDGSPDTCPEMCEEWAKRDSRIKVIHKENGGQSSARNLALDVCKGDYVSFLDSDDYLHKDVYKVQMETMKKHNVDIVTSGHINVDESGTPFDRNIIKKDGVEDSKIYTGSEFLGLILNDIGLTVIWDKLYKREVIGDTRFVVGALSEEICFLSELIEPVNKIIYIEDKLYYYTKREGSTTSGFNEKFYFDRIKNMFSAAEIIKVKCPEVTKYARVAQFRTIAAFFVLMPYSYITSKRDSYNVVLKLYLSIKPELKESIVDGNIKLVLKMFSFSKTLTKFMFGILKILFKSKIN